MLARLFVFCLISAPTAGYAQATQAEAPAQVEQAVDMLVGSMQVDATHWNGLLAKIIKHGGAAQAEYVDLEDIRGNEHDSHTASSISLWGEPSGTGTMNAYKVEMVYEDFKIGAQDVGNDHFYIDQWTFTLNMDGTLNRYSHGFLIENLNRDHPRLGALPLTGAHAMLQKLLSDWYQYTP